MSAAPRATIEGMDVTAAVPVLTNPGSTRARKSFAETRSRSTSVSNPPLALPATAPAATPALPLSKMYATAQGKQGAELLAELSKLVRSTHRPLDYDAARAEMFGKVEDPDGDDKIDDVYTGREFAGVRDAKTGAQFDLNTEHVWPRSRGAKGWAQGDLHNLFASDERANSERSSLPFGLVENVLWETEDAGFGVSKRGTDAKGQEVFEPRSQVRGDIARAQLYFYTRYREERPQKFDTDTFRYSLKTLLRWHAEDAVDAAERARNDEIAKGPQGNRNPYVDNPEFVERVDFPSQVTEVSARERARGRR